VRFRARHHYHNPDWDDGENARRFGDQAVSHEHGWRVVVHVAGPVDPATGWCCDLARLDGALDGLTAGWDGGDLNVLVPEVADGALRPSTENLARWVHHRLTLGDAVEAPASVVRVEVHESDDLGSVYPAD
jgi:6-pyruvoyltetrahydropterin/6-carboxytetrahydropterin synthase